MEGLKAIIEALILVSDTPLSAERICSVLPDTSRVDIICALRELVEEYDKRRGGFRLEEVAGGYQFRTRPEFGSWIKRLKRGRAAVLTPAALETLAIIAYLQPVVKADIDRIRGVDTGGALKGLLEKKLAKIVGRKDIPGNPIIYGTSKKFLEVFALKDLSELPTLRELEDLQR